METKFKSDKDAKASFVQHLEENGFTDVQIVKAPSDIIAKKNGIQWYFEIKMTTHRDKYFGAATFTEWEQAFKTPETYRFVIAIKDEAQATGFEFIDDATLYHSPLQGIFQPRHTHPQGWKHPEETQERPREQSHQAHPRDICHRIGSIRETQKVTISNHFTINYGNNHQVDHVCLCIHHRLSLLFYKGLRTWLAR